MTRCGTGHPQRAPSARLPVPPRPVLWVGFPALGAAQIVQHKICIQDRAERRLREVGAESERPPGAGPGRVEVWPGLAASSPSRGASSGVRPALRQAGAGSAPLTAASRALQTGLVARATRQARGPPFPAPGGGEDPRRGGGGAGRGGGSERLWLRARPRAPWLRARPARVRPALGTAAPVI